MTTLAWFDRALFTRLVLTFGHFLWQGMAIALVVLLLSIVLRNSSARLRYVFFLAALMTLTLCPIVTFWFVQVAESGPALAQPVEPTRAGESEFLADETGVVTAPGDGTDIHAYASEQIPAADIPTDRIEESEQATSEALTDSSLRDGQAQAGSRWQWVPSYLTAVYLLGVILLLGRLLLGLHGGRHLRRQSQLIDEPELLSGIARSAKALGMRFTPTVLYCKQVAVPTVVGVFRPAILLPLSLTTGLSPDQVEAVLTHELAHVLRYDHLINILQRVIESLLFFHPAVWWVSHRTRIERENCCDDIVIAMGTEPLRYAACLLDIAERGRANWPSRQLETAAALHATESGSLLSRRIRRLVSGSSNETLRLTRSGLVLSLACLAFVVFGAVLLQGQTESTSQVKRSGEGQNKLLEAHSGELSAAIADGVERLIQAHDLPFMTDERLKEIRAEFAGFLTKHQRDNLSDDRKKAILSAIDLHGAKHLGLDRYRPEDSSGHSLNNVYLSLPDHLLTLKWKLWNAISHPPLTAKQQQQHKEQRQWMTNQIDGLPPYHTFTKADAASALTERFLDPLCSVLDRPMTDKQFEDFQTRLQKYPPETGLGYVVTHIVQQSLYAHYADSSDIKLPFDDRLDSYGAGRMVHLGFRSNRSFRGDNRALDDVENGYSVVDATNGYPVSIPNEHREPNRTTAWLNQHGKGDFGYDDAKGGGLFAARDAKLVLLDVENWIEADAITDDALRVLLEKQGAKTIPLKKYYEAHRNQHKTHPSTEYIGPYIGILNKEGRLAVVHVEGFSGPEEIHYRVRPRADSGGENVDDGHQVKKDDLPFRPVVGRDDNKPIHATKDGKNGPRAVVAKWMDFVLAENIRDAWALTTKPLGSDLNAKQFLAQFKNEVRIERSLGNESVAVVVTNSVKHKTGKDIAFAFWVVRRDGSWLINTSYMDDPEVIEEQLRGFSIGGGGRVKWRVSKDDIVGIWLSGPGKAGGVGDKMCESRFQLNDNGTFTLEMWGPAGRSRAAEVKRGTWRLEEDRIVREQDKQRMVSRVSWMGNDSLVLQPADGQSLDGRAGTHYHREKVAEKQTDSTRSEGARDESGRAKDDVGDRAEKGDSPSKAPPSEATGAANNAKPTKTVYLPAANSRGKNAILDLTSGDMLADPPEVNELTVVRPDNGYLAYKDELLGLLQSAKAMIWNKDRFVPLESAGQIGELTAYKLPSVPCRLLVTTAVRKQFDVTILSETKDGGIVLEYRAVAESPAKSAATDADHKRLRGVWKALSVEENGHAKPEIDGQLIFQSGRFQMLEEGRKEHAGFYTIDPSQNPKTIDFRDVTRPFALMRAIYEFPGEGRLRICYSKVQNERPTGFDSERDRDDHFLVEFRFEAKVAPEAPKNSDRETDGHSKTAVSPSNTQPANTADGANSAQVTKTVYMPARKSKGKNVILELASGDMLPSPLPSPPITGGLELTHLGKGDLFYDDDMVVLLRGAKAMILHKDRFVPLKSDGQLGDVTGYKLPSVPCRLLITTATERQFDVTILSETKDGGIVLEYRAVAEAPAPAKSTATDSDHKRLQAAWKVLSVEKNGDVAPNTNVKYVFHADRFRFFDDDEEAVSGTYTIDPSQNPKTIDLHIVGQPELPIVLGIYDFPAAGRMRICYGDKPDWRPTRFDSKQDGGNVAVLELQLKTADAPATPKHSDRPAVTPTKPDKDDTPKTSSVALQRLSAKGNVLRWRIEPANAVRILQGTVDIIGSRDGSKSFITPQGVGGRRLTHSHPFELRVETRKEGRYLWITTTLGDSHRNEGTAVKSKFDFPRGSRMQIVPWNARGDWSEAPRLTTDEYANLWEARFVRDGKVVRSYVFVARLIGEDETASTIRFQPRLPAANAMPAANPTAPATRLLAETEKKV